MVAVLLGVLLMVGALATIAARHVWPGSAQSEGEQVQPSAQVVQSMLDAPFAPGSLRKLSPQDARNWNSKAPVAVVEAAPASAFVALGHNPGDTMRSLDCLTAAIYYEAGQESIDGRRAVAQVILNRVRHPAFPATVCGVVFQGAERRTGCQFTFTCDGALARKPSAAGWAQARALAEQALAGSVFMPVGWATHYHADYVVPYWATSLAKIGQIGAHIFYTWKGTNGTARSFWQRYAGNEPAGMTGNLAVAEAPETLEPSRRKLELSLVDARERPVIAHDEQTGPAGPGGAPAAKAQEVTANERWIIQSPVLPQ